MMMVMNKEQNRAERTERVCSAPFSTFAHRISLHQRSNFGSGSAVFLGSMPMKAMKATRPNCVNYNRCGRGAKGPRARFCTSCFRANAVLQGGKSSGNASASGSLGNAGNAGASGSLGNAGNASASGSLGNAGNASANRWKGGNVKKGRAKKSAGERSGVRRSAKKALVVKKKWLDLILAGLKTWEIRGRPTAKRGWIHLAESQAGGKLMGRALGEVSAAVQGGFQHPPQAPLCPQLGHGTIRHTLCLGPRRCREVREAV